MNEYQELLAVNHQHAFDFFYEELLLTKSAEELSTNEAEHVASVLAHYAQTPYSNDLRKLPPPHNLSRVFEDFILSLEKRDDPSALRRGAAECLFLLGFFPEAMARRHNLSYFLSIGRTLYLRAAYYGVGPNQQKTFWLMSRNLDTSVEACQELRANWRDTPYLLH